MGDVTNGRSGDGFRISVGITGVDGAALRDGQRTMIEVGRRLWLRGYVAANDGNLSIRLGADRFLTTATGAIKGFLDERDLVVIDGRGMPVGGVSDRRPSSEIHMHLAIYEARSDVRAIVHAHPPTATGFATAGVALDGCVLPEIVATLGAVPTVPYGTPSTHELSDAVRDHVREGHAALLANHGAVTFDDDLFAAYYHMERVEHYACVLLTARQLGNVQLMTDDQVERLRDAVPVAPKTTCATCGVATTDGVPHTCVPDATGGAAAAGAPAEGDQAIIERIARALRAVIEEGEEIPDGSGSRG